MSFLSLNACDDAVDRNEVTREPEILRGNSHCESEQLWQVEYGQIEGGLDGSSCPLLVNVQTHVAEGTGCDHKVGAVILGVLHICTGHGDRDRFFFKNDGEPAALRSARIGDRLPADCAYDLFQ